MREFGNIPPSPTRRARLSGLAIEQLAEDLRFGARILRHAPGLSATAILLVALVIGGNTTIYATVRSILNSPASGVHAERLVALKRLDPGATITEPYFSYPNYRDFRDTLRTVRGLMVWATSVHRQHRCGQLRERRARDPNYSIVGCGVDADAACSPRMIHCRTGSSPDQRSAAARSFCASAGHRRTHHHGQRTRPPSSASLLRDFSARRSCRKTSGCRRGCITARSAAPCALGNRAQLLVDGRSVRTGRDVFVRALARGGWEQLRGLSAETPRPRAADGSLGAALLPGDMGARSWPSSAS
jgi:hypothetical protein